MFPENLTALRRRLRYNARAPIHSVSGEVEYVEYGGEVLPALALGVRRLSNGMKGLKVQLEDLSRRVARLGEDVAKLTQAMESSKQALDEGRQALIKQYEETSKHLSDFLAKLEGAVKSAVELELRGLSYKLSALTRDLDNLTQDLYAHRLEEKERLNELIENVKGLTGEVYEAKSKISDLSALVYSLEVRLGSLEGKLVSELTELKLLLAASQRGAKLEEHR